MFEFLFTLSLIVPTVYLANCVRKALVNVVCKMFTTPVNNTDRLNEYLTARALHRATRPTNSNTVHIVNTVL